LTPAETEDLRPLGASGAVGLGGFGCLGLPSASGAFGPGPGAWVQGQRLKDQINSTSPAQAG
jgi:hypothetical protein